MKLPRRTEDNAGFTLIEVLIAMTVLAIALTGIVNLFSKNTKAYVSQQTTLELTQELRAVLNLMTTEIRMACYAGGGFMDDADDNYDTDANSIHFTMDLDEDGNTSEFGEDVTYFVNASDQLVRRSYYDDGSGTFILNDEVAAENITDLTFTYLDEDNNATAVLGDIRSVGISLTGETGISDPLLNIVKNRTETARVRVRNTGLV